MKLFVWILRYVSSKNLEKIFEAIILRLTQKGDYFFTYIKRPKFTRDVNMDSHNLDYKEYAIIIQGPICEEYDFTVETIKIYKKLLKNITVVVSTWNDTNVDIILKCKDAGALVITNLKPTNAGLLNINYQITSTINGLRVAQSLVKKYCVKTRTDQRIYNPYFLSCTELLRKEVIDVVKYGLSEKIIVCSMSTLKYRPYGVSDMLMIGRVNDLINFWTCPMDERKVSTFENLTVKEYAMIGIAETYLMINYLKKNGIEINYSLKQTWQLYKELFIILDKSSFNLYWYKYSIEKENRLDFYYEHIYKEVTFFESLVLDKIENPNETMLDKSLVKYNP